MALENPNPLPMSRRGFVRLSAAGAAAALAFGATGLSPTDVHAVTGKDDDAPAQVLSGQAFEPGTYTAEAEGKGGKLTLSCTFDRERITDVAVLDHAETRFISDVALERVPAQIVAYQSLGVDTVTGASITSAAILAAAADCAEQAGADVAALRAMPGAPKAEGTAELDADVVVIGAGASGMGTAIACAQTGARVVVFEKTSNMGGNALVSGGYLEYMDAPEDLRAPMTEGYRAYFERIMALAEEGGVDPEALAQIRAEWDAYYATGTDRVFDCPAFYSLDLCVTDAASNGGGSIPFDEFDGGAYGEFLKTTDAWLADLGVEWDYLGGIVGFTWPRWSHVAGSSNSGLGYFKVFEQAIADQGLPITILPETPADELIMDGARVVGAKGTCADGTAYTVRASRAVVLACGGYSGNPQMLLDYNEFWGWDETTYIPTTNAYGHTGDGIRMGLEAGGHVDLMGFPMCFPYADCKDFSTETIIGDSGNCLFVNCEGVRFVDESLDRYSISAALMEQTDGKAFIISDANNCYGTDDREHLEELTPRLLERGQLFRAQTLEELAELMGVPGDALAETVERYNGFARAYHDDDFGRTAFTDDSPITTGPFYASPRTWAVHITPGGLVCDEVGHVLLDDEQTTVEGLYAVGETRFAEGGIACMGHGLPIAQELFG